MRPLYSIIKQLSNKKNPPDLGRAGRRTRGVRRLGWEKRRTRKTRRKSREAAPGKEAADLPGGIRKRAEVTGENAGFINDGGIAVAIHAR